MVMIKKPNVPTNKNYVTIILCLEDNLEGERTFYTTSD